MIKYISIIFLSSILFSISLQEIYDNSTSQNGYDKYLVLDSDSIYTGGIGIYEGDIFIDCNSAIIDLESGNGIWVYSDEQYSSSLEIEYCNIVNGDYYGLSFGGNSTGNIKNCNLLNTNYGLKLFDESNVTVTNSIFGYNETYGIGMYTENPTLNITYSLFWENIEDDCMENCPGWGSIWTQLEPNPGTGVIYENPLFENYNNFNFNLNENSPCINNGNPLILDQDGTFSDIGANTYNQEECLILGDLNSDGVINVLDITNAICEVLSNGCIAECNWDMNHDTELNVLDIIIIMNNIINNY